MKIVPGPLGKYEVLEPLGVGGMGEVWKASDPRLQRYVAIKFLHASLLSDPSFLARFVREARAVASLHHPNIVQIYDFEAPDPAQMDSPAYMVMDYIEGPTLAKYLYTTSTVRKFLSPFELVSLFSSIGEAIDYAHQRGLLHRDIKPGNILLDHRHTERNVMGEPILTDFGIVKMLGSATGALTSSSAGTPLYISPEQALGHSDSGASDLYSLGVILYQMCTGILPFVADSPFALMQQHISKLPEPPEKINATISPALSAVILRSLAKEPEARFSSASAMVEAIAEALNVAVPMKSRGPISSPDLRTLDATTVIADAPLKGGMAVVDTDAATLITNSGEEARTIRNGTPAAAKQGAIDVASPAGMELRASATPLDPSPSDPPKMESTTPTRSPDPITPYPPSSLLPQRGKQRRVFVALIATLVVVLVGSGLATFLVLHSHSSTPSSAVLGSTFFTSSGEGDGANNLGLNDTFQVNLTNIPVPAKGKSYYAWLLPDLSQSEADSRLLGVLTFQSGVAGLPTPYMDPQHNSLIAQYSRFLVTEEGSNPPPINPSLDTSLWRYYAQIPQDSSTVNCQGVLIHLSVLCHLRHLLSNDPELVQAHLSGGLNYWFLSNLKEVQKWIQEAGDSHNGETIRHKLVNVLTTLDGTVCIQQDLLRASPGESNVSDDAHISITAAISLLNCALTPASPGYLAHIHNHISAILQSPGVTGSQKTLGIQVGSELTLLNEWLVEVQKDGLQLVALDNEHLLQTNGRDMISHMNTLITNIMSGGTDPQTGQLQKGAISASIQIQQMANMDVRSYTHT